VISRTFAALAAAALVFGSSAAMAQSAAPLSVGNAPAIERATADTSSESELRGRGRWIIYAIALALIVWGAIELLDDDPDSP
jgi:DNA-binding transcriptional regulator YdaS (Cro superfamily)